MDITLGARVNSGADPIGIGVTCEELGVGILVDDDAVDDGLEVDERIEGAALQAPLGEFGKGSFDDVEPSA